MKEPKRLLSHGATDFERQLLRAVVSERPSALLRSRMQRGLGLVGPLAWASNVKALLGTLTSRVTMGAVVVGVVVAGSFSAVRLLPSQSPSDPASADEQPPASAIAAPPALPSAALPPEALPAAGVPAPVPSEAASPAAAPSELSPTPAAPNGPSTVVDDDSQLREEIALLDAARGALQRGERESARHTLSTYRERFPSGILRREAKVLWGRAEGKAERAAATDD